MAVYTEVSDTDLEAFLGDYDLGRLLAYKGIAEGVENSNFFVHAEAGFFILTLYEKRVEANELPYFLGLMEHLAKHGLNCPQPVKTKAGALLGKLAGRPAAIVTFLEGVWSRRPTQAQCAALGEALGNCMKPARIFPASGPMRSRSMPGQSSSSKAAAAATACRKVSRNSLRKNSASSKRIGRATCRMASSTPISSPTMSCFSATEVSGLIDFYFACNDFYAYDLAVCLNAWCFEPDMTSFNITKGMAMIDAYEKVRG